MGRQGAARDRVPVDTGVAELVPDADRTGGWTLLLDGVAQSHVDLDDPGHLEFEYVRLLGHLADLVAPEGEPLSVVHLGGGAWTLARYVAATRPGSRQRVVERDARLVEVVRQRLPAAHSGIRVRIGDARRVVAGLGPATADLIVLDAFAAARTPAHLTSVEFTGEVSRVLRPNGSYAVNLADGPPLDFARGQAATLAAVFGQCCLVGPPQVLRGRRFGNLVLVGSRAELPVARLARRAAADPFPSRVLGPGELARWAGGAAAVRDAYADASPAPPDGAFGRLTR